MNAIRFLGDSLKGLREAANTRAVTAMSKGKTAKGSNDTYASVWDALADTREQAANLRARAELMRQIAAVVKDGGWTQVDAATRCGITQPRINDLLRGRVSRFSIDALVNIATALGRTVRFDLQVARGRRAVSQRGSGHPSSAAL